jgi:hypothetical protein
MIGRGKEGLLVSNISVRTGIRVKVSYNLVLLTLQLLCALFQAYTGSHIPCPSPFIEGSAPLPHPFLMHERSHTDSVRKIPADNLHSSPALDTCRSEPSPSHTPHLTLVLTRVHQNEPSRAMYVHHSTVDDPRSSHISKACLQCLHPHSHLEGS